MILDKLYEMAFEYKKTKLWEILWDMEIFAVKLSDGQTGYISIMGAGGGHCALGLFIGESGYNSLCTIVKADSFTMSPLELQEYFLQQECLQCAFEKKDELSFEEREEAKKYARAHGIRIAGNKAYPHFIKYEPYCCPWHLETEKEQEDLCEALAAAIEMARLLKNKMPFALGLREINEETETVPMLELKDGAYVLGQTKLPGLKRAVYPEPKASNDISIAKLKKAKKAGVWECKLVHSPQPVQDEVDEVPFFPSILLAAEASTGYILPVPPVEHYERNPEEMLKLLMEALNTQKICPLEFKVQDERTYALVKDFCGRLGIAVSIEEDLPALADAECAFFERFGMSGEEELDDIIEMLGAILDLDEKELRSMPSEVVSQLELLVGQNILPADIERKLKKVFHFEDSEKTGPEKTRLKVLAGAPECSYVISVSLGTGCYRHIKISGDSTLFELHETILNAFNFMDDHAHAFFMNNSVWSEQDSYYSRGGEIGDRTTDRYRLYQVGLSKGKQFKYVFDFGDEWTFQCKVLRVVDGNTDVPVVIKSKGEAPDQYGDPDDDWDDDWDDDSDDE